MPETNRLKRIVVKVGTSTLTYETGRANIKRMAKLVSVLSDLRNAGYEVVLVTSGAISIGVGKLGLKERPVDVKGRQAAAAVGQCELMFLYDKLFSEYTHVVAQLLISRSDVEHPEKRQNLINSFEQLFAYQVIPVVNENDSVSTEELAAERFGDNDCLSAYVAQLVGADILIMLTDIDGLYDGHPGQDASARLIPVVAQIDDHIRKIAGASASSRGTGGMATKIHAAQIATDAGIPVVIMSGEKPTDLYQVLEGNAIGTYFEPKGGENR
ncbi:MAG: glutamate 5-kinase [Clostridiales bacterium]|nr:glutamate 5-kinase [Clostridiales bacterium]